MHDTDKKESLNIDNIIIVAPQDELEEKSLGELREALDVANRQIGEAITNLRQKQIEELVQIIIKYEISAQDLAKALGSKASELGYSLTPQPEPSTGRRRYPPKFRGPNGATWTGMGRSPKWMGERDSDEYKENERRFLISEDGSTPYERKGKAN